EAVGIAPDPPATVGAFANCALAMCDWARTARLGDELRARVASGRSIINPFMFLGYCDDAALQLQCARTFIRHRIPRPPPPLRTRQVPPGAQLPTPYP